MSTEPANRIAPQDNFSKSHADYFLESLPERPYCRNHSGERLIMPRDAAAGFSLIQINHPRFLRWLWIPVDRPDVYHDAVKPFPSVEVWNHAGLLHAGFELAAPVSRGGNARRKPLIFFNAVQRQLTQLVGGTPFNLFSGLGFNPLHDAHAVRWSDRKYDLAELAEYRSREIRAPGELLSLPVDTDIGRNNALFQQLTAEGSAMLRTWQGGFESYAVALLARAFKIAGTYDREKNSLGSVDHFSDHEITATAHSVARMTWERRRKRTLNLPPLQIGTWIRRYRKGKVTAPYKRAMKSRHQAGAEFTHSVRNEKTSGKIRWACGVIADERALDAAGLWEQSRRTCGIFAPETPEPKNRNTFRATIADIASIAGLSRRAVYDAIQRDPAIKAAVAEMKSVKYALHR